MVLRRPKTFETLSKELMRAQAREESQETTH
jgi:hypothetical protein